MPVYPRILLTDIMQFPKDIDLKIQSMYIVPDDCIY